MKTPILNKLFSLFSSFSFLLNSVYTPLIVLAQEASPTPEPTPIVEVTATPAPSQEPTAVPTETATVSPEPTVEPTESASPTAMSTEEPTATPTETPHFSPEPSQEPTVVFTSIPAATPSIEPTQSEQGQLSAVVLSETEAASIEEFDLTYHEDGSATIQTDKLDYAPTDTVLITGAGFIPNKEYSLEITSETGNFKFSDRVSSDESGNLFYSYQLDGTSRPNYRIEIKDSSGTVIASAEFTDPQPPQPNVNLDQCRNGSASSPNDCLDFGGSSGWVNGNAGSSNSHYVEGFSIPYRAVMTNLPLSTTITLDLGYDVKHSDHNALDYLTYYNRLSPHTPFGHSSETINPTSGVSGISGTTTTFAIPSPSSSGSPVAGQPTTSFDALPSGEKVLTLFGGTITNATYLSQGDLTAQSAEAVLRVTFTVDSANAVLAWGGHIASRLDWGFFNGDPRSAGGISGSPYHMRLVSWSLGNLGSTDKSLSADAVIPASNITIHKVTSPVGGTGFGFTTSGGILPATFNLDDGGTQNFSAPPGTYSISENDPSPNYTLSDIQCTASGTGTSATPNVGNRTIGIIIGAAGAGTVDCTFYNSLQLAHLTLIKTVTTDNGGSAVATDWTLNASGPTPISGISGSPAVTGAAVNSGTYTLSESGGPSGYTPGSWSCVKDTGSPVIGNSIVLAPNDNATCTINNDDNAPSLTLNKILVNDNGGTAVESNWTLSANGPTPLSGPGAAGSADVVSGSDFSAGTYTLSESAGPSGYSTSLWSCTGTGIQNDNQITLDLGQSAVCFVTNNDQPGKIVVDKVTNPQGDPQKFDFTLSNATALVASFQLSDTDTPFDSGSISAGNYNLVETVPVGWDLSSATCDNGSNADNISVALGETVICTFTNTKRSHLIVNKITDPFSDVTTNFIINVLGGTVTNGSATRTIIGGETEDFEVISGTYSVTENSLAGWYPQYACSDIVIDPGETEYCTINNTKYGSITIIKDAVPDDPEDFNFVATGSDVGDFTLDDDGDNSNGLSNTQVFSNLLPGSYSFIEGAVAGWDQSLVNCDSTNGNDSLTTGSATIDLSAGENVICTFVNTHRGKITIVKDSVPDRPRDFEFRGDLGNFILDDDSDSTHPNNQTFSGLLAGRYEVRELSEDGWQLQDILCGGNGDFDIENHAGSTRNVFITLRPGADVTCTFVNFKLGSVSGIKYDDVNANGNFDDGNPAKINDWRINLYSSLAGPGGPELVSSILTGQGSLPNGKYEFENLNPGVYYACEESRSGWSQTEPTGTGYELNGQSCYRVDLSNGEARLNKDFGNFQEGIINVCKYDDLNADGQRGEEPPLSGVTMSLYKWGEDWSYRTSQNTGENGCTTFTGLPAGQYKVAENVPAGYYPTSPDYFEQSVQSGTNVTLEFLNARYGLIQGKKFKDNNHNGTRQAGEPYLNNWLIILYQQGDGWQEFKSMQTGADNTEAGNVDQGQYRFVDLQPGNYLVCEEDRPGWDQTRPTSGPDFNGSICYEVELLPGEEEIGLTFGNFELGKIQGKKFNDEDGDGLYFEPGEEFMNGWTVRLYQDWEGPVEVVTSNTGEQGQFRFTDLLPGEYQICEVLQEGWGQTWPKAGDYPTGQNGVTHPGFGTAVDNLSGALDEAPVCWQTTIDTSGEFNYFLRFGNAQLSDIHGFKWNDLNGDGLRDEEEPKLDGWRIFIDENDNQAYDPGERNMLTDDGLINPLDFGWYWFRDLLPGTYDICEELLPGWEQTFPSPVCHRVRLPYLTELTRLFIANFVSEAPAYKFGNWEVAKEITIEKSNDKGGGANAGETVTYTLKITNTGKVDLTGVEVTDVLPGGFSYVAGSTTIGGVAAADPVISSGVLRWSVGLFGEGESITLIYQATIPSDAVLGSSFVNYATCYGWVLKGREEKINCNVDDSSLTIGKSPSYGGNLTPQVLGAATELPATGSSTWILFLAVVLGLGGLALKLKTKKLLLFLMALTTFGLIPVKTVMAAIIPQVSISKLPEYVNSNSFKLSYSAISDDPASISAQFSYLKEGGSWQNLGAPILGASGQVQVTGSQVDEQMKKYTFKVEITGTSDQTITTYDISGPSPVSNYYKDHSAVDFNKLHWKNPSDSDFAKVIIYRGETADFSADGSHSIATVAGGANSDMTYDDHTPDGSKTYYHVIRAIDKAGNSSSLVGDVVTTTTTVTATPASITTGTTVTALPKEETEGQVLPAETEEPKVITPAGMVQKAADFARNKTKLTVLIFVAISLAGYLLYRRFRKV